MAGFRAAGEDWGVTATGTAAARLGQRVRVLGGTDALTRAARLPALSAEGGAGVELDAEGLWVLPGVVDCHTHLAWHDFSDPTPDAGATAEALAATLRAGVTQARDAGGLGAALLAEADALLAASPASLRPRLRIAGPMIGAEHAGRGPGHLASVVAAAAEAGSTWVKVLATGGLSAPSETVLDPVLSREELLELGSAARAAGVRVMAHAWGGPSIPWLVEAGAASIEHGIFLTPADAELLAAHGVVLVPTVAVYRQTADSDGLPAVIRDRAARAADAHPAAVAAAREAGVRIALGTDAGTPRQHGGNLAELAALAAAGLAPEEALTAATLTGAELLREPGDPADPEDLVLLDLDPRRVDRLGPDRVVAVVVGGRLAHLRDDHTAPHHPIPGGTP